MPSVTQWITGESDVNTKRTRKKRNESRVASRNTATRAEVGDRTENRRKAYRKAK